MELPALDPTHLKSKEDFLKFVINEKRTIENWKELGVNFSNYLLSFVDETAFDANDKEQLTVVFDRLMSPISMTISILSWIETDEKIMWELLLMQMSVSDETRYNDGETMNAFGDGIQETLLAKWPQLNDL